MSAQTFPQLEAGAAAEAAVGGLALFRSIVVNATDAVLVTEAEPVDTEHGGPRVVYVNEAFTRMTGHRPEDILGRTPRVLQHPRTDPAELDRLRAALRSWRPVEVELLNRRADGSDFWVQISITPVADETGWFTHWVSIQRDITERRLREDRLRATVRGAIGLALVVDDGGVVRAVGPAVRRLLGWSGEELTGVALADLVHAEDRAGLVAARSGDSGPSSGPVEARVLHRNGAWRWFEATVTSQTDRAWGEVGVVTANDVTDRKAGQGRFRSAFDDAPIGMAISALNGRLLQVNASLARVTGRSEQELLAGGLPDVTVGERVVAGVRWLTALLATPDATPTHRTVLARPDGARVDVVLSSSVVTDSAGHPEHLVIHVEDVSEQVAFEARLSHQARHDALTGLPNRTLFGQRLQEALAGEGTARVCVALLGLDRFKEVNDTLGHHHGDQLLRQVGPRLRAALPASAMVARVGGDEFALLLPGTTQPRDAAALAAAARAALVSPFEVEGLSLAVEASVGLTLDGRDHDSLEPTDGLDIAAHAARLLQRAEIAMYAAKTSAEGFAFFDAEQQVSTPRRLALLGQLRRALDAGELVLHYQPKVDLRTGGVSGLEALVRWQHPVEGLLPPAEFVPLAENTGLIIPLTLQVLDQALAQVARWSRAGQSLSVAVNLSARCLHAASLPDQVEALLTRHGVDVGQLMLEITESAVLTDAAAPREVLRRLHQLGVGLSLDDFGTGYSSLTHLQQLPVCELKVDRSFTSRLCEGVREAAMVRTVVELGHTLGLLVVAEGVEDAETYEALRVMGCDSVQGFLLTAPLPPEELDAWLSARVASAGDPPQVQRTDLEELLAPVT